MRKFNINIYFPQKDVDKLKQLAKEGVYLYKLLSSKDEQSIDLAIGILESNKLKVGRLLRKEYKRDNPGTKYLHVHMNNDKDSIPDYFYKLNIKLLTNDEIDESFEYDLLLHRSKWDKAEKLYTPHNLNYYETFTLLPNFILKYIRYIQQDGKI